MTAKLLVVDDEPRTAELTAEILRRAGYSVDVAGSGTEALERQAPSFRAPDGTGSRTKATRSQAA